MSLIRNAYSELRKAGYFSGTDPADDKIVALVTRFVEEVHHSELSREQIGTVITLIADLAFGDPISAT